MRGREERGAVFVMIAEDGSSRGEEGSRGRGAAGRHKGKAGVRERWSDVHPCNNGHLHLGTGTQPIQGSLAPPTHTRTYAAWHHEALDRKGVQVPPTSRASPHHTPPSPHHTLTRTYAA